MRGFIVRYAIAAVLAAFVPFCTMGQVAPAGWSTIVGKTCDIRVTVNRGSKGSGEAKFMQDSAGASVQLRMPASVITKVRFTSPNGIGFDSIYNFNGYTFTYNDKAKMWSGTFAGQPAYLTCPR
jgi:hypothetical protein